MSKHARRPAERLGSRHQNVPPQKKITIKLSAGYPTKKAARTMGTHVLPSRQRLGFVQHPRRESCQVLREPPERVELAEGGQGKVCHQPHGHAAMMSTSMSMSEQMAAAAAATAAVSSQRANKTRGDDRKEWWRTRSRARRALAFALAFTQARSSPPLPQAGH